MEVVAGGDISEAAYSGDGVLVNSGYLDGLTIADAKKTVIEHLVADGRGAERVEYKLRDWLFARQRYWGEPFPVVYDADGLGAYLRGYLQGAVPYQGGRAALPQRGQKMAYTNLRSQCHYLAADAINGRTMRIATAAHREDLEQEIYACLRTSGQNSGGAWGVVPKDSTDPPGPKARLSRSPDLFDTVAMRFALDLGPQPIFADALTARVEQERRIRLRRPPQANEGNTRIHNR